MASSRPYAEAPEHPLPSTPFFSIEYPGYVQPSSIPTAVNKLGGQLSLENAFKRTATKADALLELSLRPNNPFSHPVPGDVVNTSNLLMKVVKKKRKGVDENGSAMGEYTAQVVGVIPKTVRFRSMVDYQYQVDMNDPVAKLRVAMNNLDVDAIQAYTIPEEKEDYSITADPALDPQLSTDPLTSYAGPSIARSNLRLFPPPLFSRQGIPQNYNFKANPSSVITTMVDEATGVEHKRMVNKGRWKGYGPASISFTDPSLPTKPPPNVEKARQQADKKLLERLRAHFEERPVWTRQALLSQFTPSEARDIHNSKFLLPLVCYVFYDGPWRDTLLRFGYEPRKNPEARIYQRIYFRNANHPISRPSVISRRERPPNINAPSKMSDDYITQKTDRNKAHIFDGVNITKDTAAFQLCDIEDPMLKRMIREEDDLRETCNERDGWYSAHAFERIKIVLRHKFFAVLEGHIPTDAECEALLVVNPETNKPIKSRSKKLKPGKHNMAKGALRPEDAAALRLRSTLDRNTARAFLSHRGTD